ncbi:hypothetical protein Bca101_039026 [Brassica carinata]
MSYNWKNLPPFGIVGNSFPWITWNLWTSWNKLIFENKSSSSQKILSQSIRSMKKWELAQPCRPSAALKLTHPTQSLTLPALTIFCNTDAAWKPEFKSVGLAWTFSDQSNTELVHASSAHVHVSSPSMAEALAIQEALTHVASLHFTHICLRTDFQVLSRAINRKTWTMELYEILSDINSFLSPSTSFSALSFSFPVLSMGLLIYWQKPRYSFGCKL